MTNGTGNDLADFSMLELFRTEVQTYAAILSDGLLALEANPGMTENIESLMRAAHSIKGGARIVQLEAVVKLAHAMEDCFVAVEEKQLSLERNCIDILLKGVDVFYEISHIAETELKNWLSKNSKVLEALAAEISDVKTLKSKTDKKIKISKKKESPPLSDSKDTAPITDSPLFSKSADALIPLSGTMKSDTGIDSAVRVTAENLTRLMGLAGEFLIEVRWLRPFSRSLLNVKNRYVELYDLLAKLSELTSMSSVESLVGTKLDVRMENYLMESRQKMIEGIQNLSEYISDFEIFAKRCAGLSNRLHREVINIRMRPFADGVQGFPRMVRDVSKILDKKVKFEIYGKSTPVDRDILEKLEAPLNHILRNSIDHGIEFPSERIAAGKPEEGRILVEARHRAGMLSITVADDGRGMNYEKLREKIVEKNLITKEMSANLSESELVDFLFLPGFSTSDEVTEISGRGVGLDVVQSMVNEVGGIVRVHSEPGKLMSINMQLPLTLSVIRTLLVEISGETYAFPLSRIDQSLAIQESDIELVEDRQYFQLNGHNIGLVPAYQVLELRSSSSQNKEYSVVFLSDQASRYGLVVDRFLNERNLVVQPIDPRLGKIQNINASAIMADGSPVLIVDVEDMVRSIEKILSGKRLKKVSKSGAKGVLKKRKNILVVDDSITVREVEQKILENVGYNVDIAVNGMDGWNAVREGNYDLVVSDVDMPRMDGIKFTKLIKQDHKLKDIPVIIVSYKDSEEDRTKGLDAGADYYLTKSSFHNESFVNAVVDLIGKA